MFVRSMYLFPEKPPDELLPPARARYCSVWVHSIGARMTDHLAVAPAPSTFTRSGQGESVWVVSSDTLQCRSLGALLEDAGYSAISLDSAASALDQIAVAPPDLVLLDTQTRGATIVADPSVERQLTPDLLRSTARTTMALPLRSGERYRQATLDGLERLSTVLAGGEDPGEPVEETVVAPASTIPTLEETAKSNAFTWIIGLLAVGTIVPMLTWWIFSR